MRKALKVAGITLLAVHVSALTVAVYGAPETHSVPSVASWADTAGEGDPASSPCRTEDSVSCFWDAQARGNGVGRSFWADGDGTVHYVR